MSHPILYQEKLLRPAVMMLEQGAEQEEDETLRVLSLRALGNMAHGAPRKVLFVPRSRSLGHKGMLLGSARQQGGG